MKSLFVFLLCIIIFHSKILSNHLLYSSEIDTTVLVDSKCGPFECLGIGFFNTGVYVMEGDSVVINAEGGFFNGVLDVPDANGFANPPDPIYGLTVLPSIASNSLVGCVDTSFNGSFLLDDGLDIHPLTGETGTYYGHPGIFGPGFVGTSFSATIPAGVSGDINFAINDIPLADNDGFITVTIEVVRTSNMISTTNSIDNFFVSQNYPNPFNPNTKIQYSIPQLSNVVMTVFDILGNEIETLVNEKKPTGTYEITWYAEGLPSGIYFYQLKAGSFVETKKMILLK